MRRKAHALHWVWRRLLHELLLRIGKLRLRLLLLLLAGRRKTLLLLLAHDFVGESAGERIRRLRKLEER